MYLPVSSDTCFLSSMEFGELSDVKDSSAEPTRPAIQSQDSVVAVIGNGDLTRHQNGDDGFSNHMDSASSSTSSTLTNGLSHHNNVHHKVNVCVNGQSCSNVVDQPEEVPPVDGLVGGCKSKQQRWFSNSDLHQPSSVSSDEADCDGMEQYFEESFYSNRSGNMVDRSVGCTEKSFVNGVEIFCNCDRNVYLNVGLCEDSHYARENGHSSSNSDNSLQRQRTHCNSCPNLYPNENGAVNCLNHEPHLQPPAYFCGDPQNNPQNNSPRNDVLSPDMDFLDFDFDPAQSGDEAQGAESDNSSDGGMPHSPRMRDNEEVFIPVCSGHSNDLGGPSAERVKNCCRNSLSFQNLVSSPKYQNNCLRPLVRSNLELHNLEDICSDNTDSDSANLEACGERLLRRESSLFNIPTEEMDYEEYNLQSALMNSFGAKPVTDKQASFSPDELTAQEGCSSSTVSTPDDHPPVEKVLIWSELEACNRQVTQIGTSACGATAAINVLMALQVPFNKEDLEKHIHTRLRAEGSPLAPYLISRSCAGASHDDLVRGIDSYTEGLVYGRFFHMYPTRNFHLLKWLGSWMNKGAVPIATLNLQCGVSSGQSIPDAWHHQMVFGVGPKGVYLTNPLECVAESQILDQLRSDSVLLVRRNDVLSRWPDNCDLSSLVTNADTRWRDYNVLGQVVSVLREASAPWIPGYRRNLTSHVKIPAIYKSGITLFVKRDSELFTELTCAPELPMLHNTNSIVEEESRRTSK